MLNEDRSKQSALLAELGLVLGQPDLYTNLALRGFSSPGNVQMVNGMFFVYDSGHRRVLIYDGIPQEGDSPILVLGQKSFGAFEVAALPDARTLGGSGSVWSDGTRIVVMDVMNHRVLIWNEIPDHDYAPADVVVGQPNFNQKLANNGGASGRTLNYPTFAAIFDGRLFVADRMNSRVLVWETVPTTNFAYADYVIGQPDLDTVTPNTGGISDKTLRYPAQIHYDGTRFFVVDDQNHRTLIWNTLPTVSDSPADVVLGQSTFTTRTRNQGGRSAATQDGPWGVFSDGTRLVVTDAGNYRALIWNTMPTVNKAAADVVLGQDTFTTADAPTGSPPSAIHFNVNVFMNDSKLFITNTNHHRVSVWNSMPSTNNAPADAMIGQSDLNSSFKGGGAVSATSLHAPTMVSTDGTRLFVADGSHRILEWATPPRASNTPADRVLGQQDMQSSGANNGGISDSTVNFTYWGTARVRHGKLFVADDSNHRVLIWNSLPTSNGTPADVILGQPDAVSGTPNNGGRSAATLNYPGDVDFDGTRVFVADYLNHRVLIWNSIPSTHGAPADIVLGQATMTDGTANAGGLSEQSLNFPNSVVRHGNKLLVADDFNYRVLVWNSVPTSNHAAADVVIGQADFTSVVADYTDRYIGRPNLLSVSSDGRLFIPVPGGNRILVWNSIPTSNFQAASDVIGQSDFTSIIGGLGPGKLRQPYSAAYLDGKLWIADYGNNRVLAIPYPKR